jgi:hypothetical protein
MATYRQRNVPTIEAFQLPDPDDDDGIAAFHDWSEKWNFEWESDRDCTISFRKKQTMAAEEWVNVKAGDWIIFSPFDFYTMDDKSFRQYYEQIEE